MISNLALFCLATIWPLFKKLGDFFPNHLVTLGNTSFGQKSIGQMSLG
jgi:hypothetical protein